MSTEVIMDGDPGMYGSALVIYILIFKKNINAKNCPSEVKSKLLQQHM
jgi:hypothetical protein